MSSILELEYAQTPTRPYLRVAHPPAATPVPLRLTRRGRLVVLAGAIAALVVLAVALGPTTVATDTSGTQVPASTVTVSPGETLWDLAVRANPPGQDVRVTVGDIMRLNSLTSAGELQAGGRIAVPIYR